ncbi:MAG: hypothetical protein D6754_15180 [Alphaproteobacteria bacterium]|nr:MAG: hypothetical protein D6754_15180 [Alphaproteobacteria bacterium]
MTRWLSVLPLCLALAVPAGAVEERLDGAAFRALSEGYTLHFEQGGVHYGTEQYFRDRRSLWRPGGSDRCEEGRWYEENGAICFIYEDEIGPACWHVIRRDGDVYARSVNDPDGLAELHLYRRDRVPLNCKGPSVGT